MSFVAVGTNHKYSPIEFRERIYFSKRRTPDALCLLKAEGGFYGSVILSTCNRVEIYAGAENPEKGSERLINFISRYQEIHKDNLLPYLYIHEGKEAIRHLFFVACGLDSLILGEPQISGQVEEAFLESKRAGFTGRMLKEIFTSAVSFAKDSHRRGIIPAETVSAGSAAVGFIRNKFGSISDKNILIIGAGRVTESVAGYLKEEAPRVVFVANRNFEKAKQLADGIGAKAVRFGELKHFFDRADIVITATGSPHFIISKDDLKGMLKHRMLIIDLALPRDVDPGIKGMENIDLFTLEELYPLVNKNAQSRKQDTARAEEIIGMESEKIWAEYTRSAHEPALLP